VDRRGVRRRLSSDQHPATVPPLTAKVNGFLRRGGGRACDLWSSRAREGLARLDVPIM
jgi:hypothetical protein